MARNLGMGDITWFSQVGYGGGAGCAVVGNAAMAVATGQADGGGRVAVAQAGRGRLAGRGPQVGDRVAGHRAVDAAVGPRCGRSTRSPCSPAATCTSTAPTREHLANVAVAFREHANRNPAAMMHDKPMTRDDYMAARWISEPLCLFDNCLETDGAVAAVIVDAPSGPRDLPQPPVLIHAFGQGLNRQHQTMTNYHRDDPLMGPGVGVRRGAVAPRRLRPRRRRRGPALRRLQPARSRCRSRATASASGARARTSPTTATSSGPTAPAREHVGRRDVRGLRARLQPDRRGRPPDAGHVDRARSTAPTRAWSPAARASPPAPCCCGGGS